MAKMVKNTKSKEIVLSDFLREARLKAGMSQGDVAKKLGYTSPQFISNWERGICAPPIRTLKTLVKVYEVPEDVMFNAVLDSTVNELRNALTKKFFASAAKS